MVAETAAGGQLSRCGTGPVRYIRFAISSPPLCRGDSWGATGTGPGAGRASLGPAALAGGAAGAGALGAGAVGAAADEAGPDADDDAPVCSFSRASRAF